MAARGASAKRAVSVGAAGRSPGHSRSPSRTSTAAGASTPPQQSPTSAAAAASTPPQQNAQQKVFTILVENMKVLDQKITDVISAGQIHEQRIMKLESVGQVYEQRIMKLEADTKAIGDGMGTFGRHVQAMDDRLKGHIGATVDDLNQAMIAIDVALRQTVAALETRLGEFQGSAQELMN